jgi:lipopolysaccharide export system protein LptA
MRQCIKTLLTMIAVTVGLCASAQVPQEAKSVQNFEKIFYRNTPQGKVPEAICSGKEATPLDNGRVEIKDFELQTLREQKTEFIARSPECVINVKEEFASSAAPLRGYNANTNFYIEGIGFLCTKSNSLLVISNNVETRIVKAAIKGQTPLATDTNAGGGILKIYSDHFRLLYQSNLAMYVGQVQVIDPRLTLTCDLLTTHFGTNGAIQSVTAERNVVLTDTNGSRATGDMAVYTVVGTNETVDLIGHAHWSDGQHDVTARSFFYDGNRDELIGADQVKVHYANNTRRAPRGTNDFSELFANEATISNATRKYSKEQNIFAQGDVKMTNHFDHSYAESFRAVYTATNSVLELSGNPLFRNEHGEVSGYVLSIDRPNGAFHSRGNTQSKLINVDVKNGVQQRVFVNSTDLDYTTNEAKFFGNVAASMLNNGVRAADLTSDSLVVKLGPSNQLIRAVAQDNVRAQRTDAKQRTGTLWCDTLIVNRNPRTGLLVDASAQGHCRFEETNSVPKPAFRKLTASNFFTKFSPITNKVEQFTATGGIKAIQISGKRTNEVHGSKMVYTFAPVEKIEVTGNPKARSDRAIISNANIFTFFLKSNTFRASGPYKIVPTAGTNTLSSH